MAVPKKSLKQKPKYKERNSTLGSRADRSKVISVNDEINRKVAQFNDDFTTYAAKARLANVRAQSVKGDLSGMSRMYYSRMAMMCAMPLMRGFSVESVASSMGMYFGMCMVDKNFKNIVKNMAGDSMHKAIDKYAEFSHNRIDKHGIFKDARHAKQDEKINALRTFADKLNTQGGKKKFFAKDFDGNTHFRGKVDARIPFTPESAAATNIALDKKAYYDMRQPGADIDKIRREHNEAKNAFFDLAATDGISREQILQETQNLIGKTNMYADTQHRHTDENGYSFAENDIHDMYAETAYDGVTQTPLHEEEVAYVGVDGDWHNEKQTVWSGNYQDKNGKIVNVPFMVREPLTPDDTAQVWQGVYDNAMQSNTYEEFYGRLSSAYCATGGMSDYAGGVINSTMFNDEAKKSAYADVGNIARLYRMYGTDYGTGDIDMFAQEQRNNWQKTAEGALKNHPEWQESFAKDFDKMVEATAKQYKENPFDRESKTVDDYLNGTVYEYAENPEYDAEDVSSDIEIEDAPEGSEVDSRGAAAENRFKNVVGSVGKEVATEVDFQA